ncbi:MAG: choice-of-anchor Q domain-containing protein [Solirubrobacteraceae bacterium]
MHDPRGAPAASPLRPRRAAADARTEAAARRRAHQRDRQHVDRQQRVRWWVARRSGDRRELGGWRDRSRRGGDRADRQLDGVCETSQGAEAPNQPLLADQRGLPRPSGGPCDIGAFQAQGTTAGRRPRSLALRRPVRRSPARQDHSVATGRAASPNRGNVRATRSPGR